MKKKETSEDIQKKIDGLKIELKNKKDKESKFGLPITNYILVDKECSRYGSVFSTLYFNQREKGSRIIEYNFGLFNNN